MDKFVEGPFLCLVMVVRGLDGRSMAKFEGGILIRDKTEMNRI